MEEMELITLINKGDDDAFRQLLEAYTRIIYKIINSLNLDNGDYRADLEDFYQEGSLALFKACKSFNANRGVKFSTYAYAVIRNNIYTRYRDEFLSHKEEKYSIEEIENIDYVSKFMVSDSPLEYHREQEFHESLDKLMNTLPKLDKQIMELKKEELSYKEIAERLNINKKKVDNRLIQLRKKIRELYDKENI